MKLLNCVFSYNRPIYLRNTVESLLEYFKFGDTTVIDDGSEDPKTLEYLNELKRRGVQVVNQNRFADQAMYQYLHGGLYENMDLAVELAERGGYQYVHFVQDDVQFMWHDPDLPAKVERIFQIPKASMVENVFFWGIVRDRIGKRLELIPEANCYHRIPHGLLDMGIMPVALLREHRFRFGNGIESTNSAWWRRRGYKAYRLHAPSMMYVPWPVTFRPGKGQLGHAVTPIHKYLLKPLDKAQIDQLTSRPLTDIPFAEDYCFPWGWKCKTPYWGKSAGDSEYDSSRFHPWRTRLAPIRPIARFLVPRPVRAFLRTLLGD